jgi:AbrB family looped-hinge helix DNA binding protein
MKSVVSEKGQVTIPKALRDRLGLRAGTSLDFQAEGGRLVATKAIDEDVFRKWRGRGRLPDGLSVDDYLKRGREGRADRR